jgi:hypothetical protein
VIIDPDAPIKAPPIFSRLYSLIKGRPDIVWNDNVKDQYLRSPALIPVFSLDVDQWVLAAVEKLQPPKWQDIWGQLIYPDTDKDKFERLKKMVENHRTFLEEQKEEQKHGKGDTGDFIPEKGNGLVILLSGPSGLGKTLTAGKITFLIIISRSRIKRSLHNTF